MNDKAAQCMAKLRKKRKDDGLERVEVWVPRKLKFLIKQYAEKLCENKGL